MNIIEIFGKKYEIIEDAGNVEGCDSCALWNVCERTKPLLPCEKSDGKFFRHFVEVTNSEND